VNAVNRLSHFRSLFSQKAFKPLEKEAIKGLLASVSSNMPIAPDNDNMTFLRRSCEYFMVASKQRRWWDSNVIESDFNVVNHRRSSMMDLKKQLEGLGHDGSHPATAGQLKDIDDVQTVLVGGSLQPAPAVNDRVIRPLARRRPGIQRSG
jgi:hypothetical protein